MRSRSFWSVSMALLMAPLLSPVAAPIPLQDVIVQGSSVAQATAAVEAAGGVVKLPLAIVDGVAALVRDPDTLRRDPRIRAVTPNERVFVSGGSDSSSGGSDPYPPSVYPVETRAYRLWLEGISGTGVRVALVDTGVNPHADLEGRLVSTADPLKSGSTVECANFSGEATCADTYGHGTFLAGLIAGTGATAGNRYPGMAPGSQIVSVKIAGRDGSADVSKVLAAIQYVVSFKSSLGIKILNLSLGTNSTNHYRFDPLNLAVERAWDSGLFVVVAASNRGPGAQTISKPADDPLVLTVGAVDDRGTWPTSDDPVPLFSGRGPTAHGLAKPDVVAPGARVISLRSPGSFIEEHAPGGGVDATYRRGSGTSMAAAVASGAAALFFQANPTASPDRAKFAITSTARAASISNPTAVGAGVIDIYAAARTAPAGLANQNVTTRSDGSGTLDQSRADVLVTRTCRPFESVIDPQCDRVHGERTAQDRGWDSSTYASQDWTAASWYESQWVMALGSSWYGSSWYGSSWYGSSWYGADGGQGSPQTVYGVALPGSSWYGVWD